MGKLLVAYGWSHSYVPYISFSSLFMSDVCYEPNKHIVRAMGADYDAGANATFLYAIQEGYTEILTLSGDQSVPPDILERLRAHDKDVVAALTATRQAGHHWLTFNLDESGQGWQKNPTRPLEKFDVVGPGCMLIKTKCLYDIEPPFFRTTLTKDGAGISQSSDFYFFKKLKEHGVAVYVDSTLESYHQTEQILNTKTLGRKLPYLEVIKCRPIPCKSTDQDKLDLEDGVRDESLFATIGEKT